jgi:hypothetical protein
MSRRGKVRLAVSLPIALVVLVLLGLRWQAQWNLSAYRKKLIASGEKLSLSEIAPEKTTQATNTAPFLKLASTLPPLWNNAPQAMRQIKPGVARVAWRQARCLERTDDSKPAVDVWPSFTELVRSNEPALREVLALLDAGGIEIVQDRSQPNFGEQSLLHNVVYLVVDSDASAMLALHEGRMQEAYGNLKSSGAILQLTAKDTTMIEQLVRYAIISMEVGDFWEALQAQCWTDEQLTQWQHQWGQASVFAAAEASLDLERLLGMSLFLQARSSRQGLEDMVGGGSGLKDGAEILNDFLLNPRTVPGELLTSFPRYWGWRWIWSYRDEREYLERMQSTIEITRDAQKRHAILSSLNDWKATAAYNPPKTGNFDLAGALTGNDQACVRQALCAQTEANMVECSIALERFYLAHHAYPFNLAKLVPEFVPAIPVDCMDGHDLRYRLNPDGAFLLYSVGEDRVDNGGDPTPNEGKPLGLFNGRDWVWPRPATAEELQAYEAEQSKPKKKL